MAIPRATKPLKRSAAAACSAVANKRKAIPGPSLPVNSIASTMPGTGNEQASTFLHRPPLTNGGKKHSKPCFVCCQTRPNEFSRHWSTLKSFSPSRGKFATTTQRESLGGGKYVEAGYMI